MERSQITKIVGIICLMAGLLTIGAYFAVQDDPSMEIASIPRLDRSSFTATVGENAVIKPPKIGPVEHVGPLPAGLSIDMSTGIMTGIPEKISPPVPVSIGDRVIWVEVKDPNPVWPETVEAYRSANFVITPHIGRARSIRLENVPDCTVDPVTGILSGSIGMNGRYTGRLIYTVLGVEKSRPIVFDVKEWPVLPQNRTANAAPTVTYDIAATYLESDGFNITPTGTAARFTVSPALPTGMVLNETSGKITGYAAAGLPTDHVISVYNDNGEMSTVPVRFFIEGSLVYGKLTTVTTGHNTQIEHNSDDRFDQYDVHPFLPSGLTLDKTTGAITGSAESSKSTGKYEVTAWNATSGATARGDLHLRVERTDESNKYSILGLGIGLSAVGVGLIGAAYIPGEFWQFRWLGAGKGAGKK